MTLFDQEYAMERYTEDVLQKGWEKGQQDGKINANKKTARNLANLGFSAEQIANIVEVSITEVKKWLSNEAILEK